MACRWRRRIKPLHECRAAQSSLPGGCSSPRLLQAGEDKMSQRERIEAFAHELLHSDGGA